MKLFGIGRDEMAQKKHTCQFCHGKGHVFLPPEKFAPDPLNRALFHAYQYQAWLYEAWRTIAQQNKGLNRQRRLIRRLQAELATARAANPTTAGQETKP